MRGGTAPTVEGAMQVEEEEAAHGKEESLEREVEVFLKKIKTIESFT